MILYVAFLQGGLMSLATFCDEAFLTHVQHTVVHTDPVGWKLESQVRNFVAS